MKLAISKSVARLHGLPKVEWRRQHIESILAWFVNLDTNIAATEFKCTWVLENEDGEQTQLVLPWLDRTKLQKYDEHNLVLCSCSVKSAFFWHPWASLTLASGAAGALDVIIPSLGEEGSATIWERLLTQVFSIFEVSYGYGTCVCVWELGTWIGSKEKPASSTSRQRPTWNQMVRRLAQRDNYLSLRGLLRNVFNWQVLTQDHLALMVGNVSLRQWIEGDRRRGILKQVPPELTIWKVAEEERASVGKELLSSGVLYDYVQCGR